MRSPPTRVVRIHTVIPPAAHSARGTLVSRDGSNSGPRGSFCMLGSSSPINYGSKVAVRTVSERSIWWWWVEISSQSELAAPYSGQILATHHTLRPQLLQLTPNSHHDHQLPPSFHRFSSKDRLRSCSSGTSWRHSWCGVVRCANHAAFSSGIIHAGEFDARFCRPGRPNRRPLRVLFAPDLQSPELQLSSHANRSGFGRCGDTWRLSMRCVHSPP